MNSKVVYISGIICLLNSNVCCIGKFFPVIMKEERQIKTCIYFYSPRLNVYNPNVNDKWIKSEEYKMSWDFNSH